MYATSQGMISQQVPDFYEFTRYGITHGCEIAWGDVRAGLHKHTHTAGPRDSVGVSYTTLCHGPYVSGGPAGSSWPVIARRRKL